MTTGTIPLFSEAELRSLLQRDEGQFIEFKREIGVGEQFLIYDIKSRMGRDAEGGED